MTNELQQTRYDRLVRRVGGIIGPGSKVAEALAELFPVIDVENIPPELLALAGWNLAWQSTQRPAAVGETSTSEMFNPADSGTIMTITQVGIRVSITGNFVQMELTDTPLTTAATRGLFRDARAGIGRSTVAEFRSDDDIAVGGGPRLLATSLQLLITDPNGIAVLTPGIGLRVGTQNLNTQLTVNYFWRERVAEASELNF